MSLHLNLQCQRADKNTDTRITSSVEEAWSIWFSATAASKPWGRSLRFDLSKRGASTRQPGIFKKFRHEPVGMVSPVTPPLPGENPALLARPRVSHGGPIADRHRPRRAPSLWTRIAIHTKTGAPHRSGTMSAGERDCPPRSHHRERRASRRCLRRRSRCRRW